MRGLGSFGALTVVIEDITKTYIFGGAIFLLVCCEYEDYRFNSNFFFFFIDFQNYLNM